MKKLSFFITCMLIISMITGCSSSSNSAAEAEAQEGKVVLDFWTFWGSETRRPIIEKIITDYNESQDEVYVKHTFLPWGDIWTKNLVSIASGKPADVIVNDINSVAHRAENNQASELTDYVDDEFKEQFYPHLWDMVETDGKTFAVPFTTDTRVLFYNKKAFEEVGLDPDSPPATWEELEEYAKKLDVKEGDRYERIGFYPLWGGMGADSWMINADDGQGLIEDGEVFINTENKAKGLQWVLDWRNHYGSKNVDAFSAEFGSEQANPFISGKVAMWVDVGTFYTQIRDYGQDMEIGVAPIPAAEESTGNWSAGGGFVVEVPEGSDNPEEAMDFIKYLTGPEAQKYWAEKNYDNVANIEGSEAALEELDGQEKEVYGFMIENLEYTQLFPVPVDYPDYLDQVNPVIDQVLLGEVEPEDGLEKAEESVEKIKRN
ncbi:ABC transporter substrate-binding protein [Sutcliffiella deserti]|uniref:ABC transporter substrate-binding protein n=1 Tax=Sutcliffiella deserti TaxID=2875501 RepID=UPI001CBD4BBF|nr:ABC transporter substrate-binding protein [Sutcliffiella deserti]